MSRGLGSRQIRVLIDLYFEGPELTDTLPHATSWFADPHGGRMWVLAASLDEDTGSYGQSLRPGRASTRRSVRALQRRGLVECQMLDVKIPQSGREYDDVYEITRRVLVVRFTDDGLAFAHQLVESYY